MMRFFYEDIEKDGSLDTGALIDPLKRLAAECRRAIAEARKKGILSCPMRNEDTASTIINNKKVWINRIDRYISVNRSLFKKKRGRR
ncbi:MAG TPA: hypothetical protein ENH41_02885 [Candidatus Omnitrophica bacterium]|nr:hypothetical protein [Candidatus Omnitrophota bacterium]